MKATCNEPLISIICPVYKTEKELSRCIESVLSQTYRNFELILVDDGSPDSCGEICDHFATRDSRVSVLHKLNEGVSAARNMALECAKGDYISFVDSDDWVEPQMLEFLLDAIMKNSADVSICAWYTFSENMEGAAKIPIFRNTVLSSEEAFCQAVRNGGIQGYLWNKLFDKKFFSPEGYKLRFRKDVFICEDLLMSCEVFRHSEKCVYINIPLYHYYIRSNSALRTWSEKRESELLAREHIIQCSGHMTQCCVSAAKEQYLNAALQLGAKQLRHGLKAKAQHTMGIARRCFLPVLFDENVRMKAKIKYVSMLLCPDLSLRLWGKLKPKFGHNWTWPEGM